MGTAAPQLAVATSTDTMSRRAVRIATHARAIATTSTSASASGASVERSNAVLPNIQGKVIKTIITAVDHRNGIAIADTGVRTAATYKLAELDGDVAIGDVVEARVKWMNNPMGELDLEVKGLRAERERESIWRELISARDSGTVVKGRLLNAVNGGYAVGIAGVIAFLPMRAYRGRKPPTTVEAALREAKETGKKPESPVIGDLLGFKILKMTASGESYRNIVVSGPLGGGSADRRGEAKRRERDARSWSASASKATTTDAPESAAP